MKKPILLLLFVILCLSTYAQNKDTLGKKTSDTLHSVLKEPQFRGGKDSLNLFIMKNCHYPAISREENKQGEVVIQILIEKDGHPSTLKVLKSISPEIDKELVRVMSRSPRWIPGSLNGNPVQATYTLPITFKIDGNTAWIIPH